MVTVDSRGRIVLPVEVRDNLGITPGTEVEVREECGKAVIEPEDHPDQVIDRMDRLVAEASADRDYILEPDGKIHPLAQKHHETVRRESQEAKSDDETATHR